MALQYTVIKNEKQYDKYCDELEHLVFLKKTTKEQNEIIDLLTVLLEKWDDDHDDWPDINPVEMLRFIMRENKLKPADLSKQIKVSKSILSDILNYRRGFSKAVIRKLADRFKMQQEAFNRPYNIKNAYQLKLAKKSPKRPKAYSS